MLTVYGARRLAAGIALNAGLWAARDTSPAFNRLASSGWSVAPQFALTEWATLEVRSEEHTSELQSRLHLVCRLLLEKKKIENTQRHIGTQDLAEADRIRPPADHNGHTTEIASRTYRRGSSSESMCQNCPYTM